MSVKAMHNPEPWNIQVRRAGLALASVALGAGAATIFWSVITKGGATFPDFVAVALLFVLTTWTAIWFCVTLTGFAVLWTAERREPLEAAELPPGPLPRTAVLMPIYNENASSVFAGIKAMADSVAATGHGADFDFFLLSDTTNPDIWLEEERLWREMRRERPVEVKVYYRRRRRNSGRKAGNIADFCQRWGGAYPYMVVLDADSLVEGELLVELVRRMEANERLGILQTPPLPLGQFSLLSRCQQFAARLCCPLLSHGFAWYASKEGNYWGHNAILRTAAFTRHCGLPDLPGERPLGGEILSHDFVEAALMRRAGYEVQLAPELTASYEQSPTTLAEYAQRDHRWSQGNLQHSRLVVSRNIPLASRFHFAAGVMSYAAAPLWLMFLVVSPLAFWSSSKLARYYGEPGTTLGLFCAVMTLLMLPRVLGLVIAARDRRERLGYGGGWRLGGSIVLELALSVLMAPIMMAFHTLFVFKTLRGKRVEWNSQDRTGSGQSWRAAWSMHRWQTLAGVVAGGVAYWISPQYFLWLSPIVAGLVLSIPLSVVVSDSRLGRAFRELGLLRIPEEAQPPAVVQRYQHHLERLAEGPRPRGPIFAALLQDALWVSDHIVSLEATDSTSPAPEEVVERATACVARNHYAQLIAGDKRAILHDPDALRQLHFAAWSHRTRTTIPRAPAKTSTPARAR